MRGLWAAAPIGLALGLCLAGTASAQERGGWNVSGPDAKTASPQAAEIENRSSKTVFAGQTMVPAGTRTPAQFTDGRIELKFAGPRGNTEVPGKPLCEAVLDGGGLEGKGPVVTINERDQKLTCFTKDRRVRLETNRPG